MFLRFKEGLFFSQSIGLGLVCWPVQNFNHIWAYMYKCEFVESMVQVCVLLHVVLKY